MTDKTANAIGTAIGETLAILFGWAWKALMVWWCLPIVVQRLFQRAVIEGWVAAEPNYLECFLLVYIISQLKPVRTLGVTRPQLVKIDDDKN